MECKFQVGQMVVCVAGPRTKWRASIGPTIGLIYTIRGLRPGYHGSKNQTDLLLEEIVNPPCEIPEIGFVEPGFRHECFRALRVAKTDISALRKLVEPVA